MRAHADADAVRGFARELGRRTGVPAKLYLVGGATAVLEGWRETTLDIDMRIDDLADVSAMVRGGHVDPPRLLTLFGQIEDRLFRFPAVDPSSLRAAIERLLKT